MFFSFFNSHPSMSRSDHERWLASVMPLRVHSMAWRVLKNLLSDTPVTLNIDTETARVMIHTTTSVMIVVDDSLPNVPRTARMMA